MTIARSATLPAACLGLLLAMLAPVHLVSAAKVIPAPPPPQPPAELDVFPTSEAQVASRRQFIEYVQKGVDGISAKRKAELATLKTPEEWRATQAKTRARLSQIFGELPAKKTPLNARTVGKLERDAYTLEKVIFESQPGYFVTGNLYIPKGRKFPLPGIVFPCGHSDTGKGYDSYQISGSGFATKGYVVLVFDPVGQGERAEYWDPVRKEHLVPRGVAHHHQVRQPALLVDWTLTGLRLWDGIRAVDYLEGRPEVDKNKLAAVGCSGGGQMAWYVTAVDERIKVCAVSHPGGSCEDSNLLGLGEEGPFKYEVQALVAPRPIRIIGGSDSGQVPVYRKSFDDLKLFYAGLKADMKRCELVVVPGIHSMDQNNREAAYEWLNQWFDKTAEGKPEGAVKPEKVEDTWCTESGNTIASLGGETGQTLNAERADELRRPKTHPDELKQRIDRRIGLAIPSARTPPKAAALDTVQFPGVTVKKFTYESEPGITVPALLLIPDKGQPDRPVYLFASDRGKPRTFDALSLPILLSQTGSLVLAIDVRGTGETGPPPLTTGKTSAAASRMAREFETAALQCAGFGRTTLGMRTLDMLRGIDFLAAQQPWGKRKLIVIGEGLGGLWAMTTAINEPRVSGVVSIGTLPSYRLLTDHPLYDARGYFVVPGALRDFDIPDLARLASSKPHVWIGATDGRGHELNVTRASALLGSAKNLHVIPNSAPAELVRRFTTVFN